MPVKPWLWMRWSSPVLKRQLCRGREAGVHKAGLGRWEKPTDTKHHPVRGTLCMIQGISPWGRVEESLKWFLCGQILNRRGKQPPFALWLWFTFVLGSYYFRLMAWWLRISLVPENEIVLCSGTDTSTFLFHWNSDCLKTLWSIEQTVVPFASNDHCPQDKDTKIYAQSRRVLQLGPWLYTFLGSLIQHELKQTLPLRC